MAPHHLLESNSYWRVRDAYADVVAYSFYYNDVYYRRLGNTIYLRILPTRDATKDWPRPAVINDAEWKPAQDIIEGRARVGAGRSLLPCPRGGQARQALPETDTYDPDFDHVCAVFAAAVLEDRRWRF